MEEVESSSNDNNNVNDNYKGQELLQRRLDSFRIQVCTPEYFQASLKEQQKERRRHSTTPTTTTSHTSVMDLQHDFFLQQSKQKKQDNKRRSSSNAVTGMSSSSATAMDLQNEFFLQLKKRNQRQRHSLDAIYATDDDDNHLNEHCYANEGSPLPYDEKCKFFQNSRSASPAKEQNNDDNTNQKRRQQPNESNSSSNKNYTSFHDPNSENSIRQQKRRVPFSELRTKDDDYRNRKRGEPFLEKKVPHKEYSTASMPVSLELLSKEKSSSCIDQNEEEDDDDNIQTPCCMETSILSISPFLESDDSKRPLELCHVYLDDYYLEQS